jgi:hypothetical protein
MTFAQRDAVAGKCVRGAVIYRIDRPIDVDLWPECEPFWLCVFGGGVGGVGGIDPMFAVCIYSIYIPPPNIAKFILILRKSRIRSVALIRRPSSLQHLRRDHTFDASASMAYSLDSSPAYRSPVPRRVCDHETTTHIHL